MLGEFFDGGGRDVGVVDAGGVGDGFDGVLGRIGGVGLVHWGFGHGPGDGDVVAGDVARVAGEGGVLFLFGVGSAAADEVHDHVAVAACGWVYESVDEAHVVDGEGHGQAVELCRLALVWEVGWDADIGLFYGG